MKNKSLLIFLLVIGVSFFHETDLHAVSLELNSSQTVLAAGDFLTVDIIATDAGQFSGAVFTLDVPENVFALEETPVTTDFFESQRPFEQGVADSFWTAHPAVDGKLYLAGYAVNADNGDEIPASALTLFTIHLRVKADAESGTPVIKLVQSNLCNGPAGWGTDLNHNGTYDAGDTYETASMLYTAGVEIASGQRIDSTRVKTDVLLDTMTPAPQLLLTVHGIDWNENYNGGSGGSAPLIGPVNDATNVSLSPVFEIAPYPDVEHAGANAAIIWQISRTIVFNDLVFEYTGATDVTLLRLPDFILDEYTPYFWRIQYSNGTVNPSGWIISTFTTGPDDMVDLNGNGIPDFQDVGAAENLFGANQAGNLEKVLKSEAGGLQYRLTAGAGVDAIDRFKGLKKEDVEGSDAWPVDFPFGLLAFRLYPTVPGVTVPVTIQFSHAMLPGATWWKTDLEKGVYDYSPDAIFDDNMMSVVITLTDGGPGDADGVANGVIVDPGGIVNDGSGGSLACFIDACMPPGRK